ncbi:MAG: transporter substrate-binding domain-containing protein [Bacilli bacterium]
MKKMVLGSLLTLAIGVSIVGCGGQATITSSTQQETFVVGMECGYAPFNWTTLEGNEFTYPIDGTKMYADGYDIQIAKEVANSLNKKLVIKAIDWDGLIPALTSGQIDAIIAGMSPTEDRKLSIDFTADYYTSTHVIVMEKTSKYVNATSLTDFNGAKVVGQIETLYDSLIDQLVGATHETPLGDVPTIITNITSGRADCTILEEPVAIGIIKANPDLTYVKLTNSFVVAEEDVVVSIAIAKGHEDLITQINSVLADISSSEREQLMVGAIERSE